MREKAAPFRTFTCHHLPRDTCCIAVSTQNSSTQQQQQQHHLACKISAKGCAAISSDPCRNSLLLVSRNTNLVITNHPTLSSPRSPISSTTTMIPGAALLSGTLKDAAPCAFGLSSSSPGGAGCVSRQAVGLPVPFSFGAAFGANWCKQGVTHPKTRFVRRRRNGVEAQVEMFSSDDFDVERLLGSQGYVNVSSYIPPPPAAGIFGTSLGENAPLGMDQRDISRIGGQEVGEGSVQTRLYAGRIGRGERMGTRVILKAYPAMVTSGSDADVMAANELSTHVILQDNDLGDISENLSFLYGGFQTRTGEQWLVFRDDGKLTAADYAKMAAEATTEGCAVGEWDFWDRFDKSRPIFRRLIFITKLLRGAFQGLAFMHSRGLLHQSLGPASVVINTTSERDVMYLNPRLRDLAFSTNVSGQTELGGPTLEELWERRGSNVGSGTRDSAIDPAVAKLSEGLWRRAALAGARDSLSRRSFGIADDIYAGGLLLAYMVFVPLCEAGSIDGPSLQRLLETTFRLDIPAVREYCEADDRWIEAVKFMDLDDGAGWQLLEAMLNPDYRSRPTVDAVLSHRFMTGAVLNLK